MVRSNVMLLAAALAAAGASHAAAADSVMVQCGQQYQAAKAAGTLDGAGWGQFRTECAARLKAQPTAATPATPAPAIAATPAAPVAAAAPTTPAPVATPAPMAVASPAAPAPMAAAPADAPRAGGGMAAMHQRQKQCGAEWTSQKATLVAQTPGLTWPKYWSQCNARLKAATR